MDGGLMDQFVQSVGTDGGTQDPRRHRALRSEDRHGLLRRQRDTALWNYAQRFAMSDNSYGTTFGPSAPGAINLASGDTGNVDDRARGQRPDVATSTAPNADITPDGKGGFSLTSDAQPYWDDCSTRDAVALDGHEHRRRAERRPASPGAGSRAASSRPRATRPRSTAVGATGQPTSTFIPDQFKNAGFAGARRRTRPTRDSATRCIRSASPSARHSASAPWGYKDDYIPHHEPFQYYASDREPASPVGPGRRERQRHARRACSLRDRHRHAVVHRRLRRRSAVRHAEPQLRHERLRPARGGDRGAQAARRRRCRR